MSFWRQIPGFPDYDANKRGEVRSRKVNRLLFPTVKPDGYSQLTLKGSDGKKRVVSLHRVVLAAFSGWPESDSLVAMHLDQDKSNNRPSNLRWGSKSENQRSSHRSRYGYRWKERLAETAKTPVAVVEDYCI